jgi:hypothetical protein
MAREAFDSNLVGFRNVLGDFTRAFMFRINIPSWLSSGDRNLSMLVRSTTLPAYSLKHSDIGFQGLKMRVATVAEFEPTWQVECLADESQILRGNILRWMSYTYDAGTMEASTLSAYKKDGITASQLDRLGNTTMTYGFYGLFPSKCDGIKVSHDDTEPAKFNVTFTYDYFSVIAGDLAAAKGMTDRQLKGDNQSAAIEAPGRIDVSNVNKDEAGQVENKPSV